MNTPYTVLVYDASGSMVAALENATSPTYSRAKNSADQVSVSLPRSDVKASLLDVGQRFEIVRESSAGQVVEESGYIAEHGYTDDEYVIEGYTEEIILSRYLTPAQFGWPLQFGLSTLDALIENMQSGYVVERAKATWGLYSTTESLVDYASNPAFVILSKDASDNYFPSGYITLRFEKTAEQTWERFRWISDYDSEKETVTSTVQFRLADTIAGLDTAAWSVATAGADTDIQGIEVVDNALKYLEVRVNLYTTKDDASPVLYSLEAIKREPSAITGVDYVFADANAVALPGMDADNKSFLDVLVDVFDSVGWEFKVSGGTLIAREKMGESRLNDYTLVGS